MKYAWNTCISYFRMSSTCMDVPTTSHCTGWRNSQVHAGKQARRQEQWTEIEGHQSGESLNFQTHLNCCKQLQELTIQAQPKARLCSRALPSPFYVTNAQKKLEYKMKLDKHYLASARTSIMTLCSGNIPSCGLYAASVPEKKGWHFTTKTEFRDYWILRFGSISRFVRNIDSRIRIMYSH